jgi:GR25 family glycosyltransferase involved in LPS biosynthesis
MDKNIKIFIINLDKDHDRYISIKTQLENMGYENYERVSAIYGKDVLDEYNTKLSGPQLGCYLSHLKVYKMILDQKLENAIVLEDDSIITEWLEKLAKIITVNNYDFCWIGNSRAKWPRNTCNIIPAYDYDKIEKNRVGKFLYKISNEMVRNGNCPMGTYGLLVSKKGAEKIVNDDHKFLVPIDNYLIEKKDLEKYMTIPSIIIHCYDFGSNIFVKDQIRMENPFDNIWKKFPEIEEQVLEFLQYLNDIFHKHGIKHSVINSIMIGYARQEKLIPFDNSLEIAVNITDKDKLSKIFGENYKNGKIYVGNPENEENGYPFFQIHYFSEGKIGKINVGNLGNIIAVKMGSYNSDKKYTVNIFENYISILDKSNPEWKYKCISKDHDYMTGKKSDSVYSFNCDNVLPGYYQEKQENNQSYPHYSKKRNYSKFYMILIGIILLYTVMIIYFSMKSIKYFKGKL